MKLGIGEILKNAAAKKTAQEKIEYLRANYNPTLGTILQGAYDDGVVWDLPPGTPPYKPNELVDQEGQLYTSARRLYLFAVGGHDTLKALKREALFIELLETVSPLDAEVLIAMKDKKLPHKSLTKKLISEAFPGLVEDVEA